MAYDYYKPHEVVSPQAHVQFIKKLFDGGTNPQYAFSIAALRWDENDCIGIRWNIAQNEWDDVSKKSGADRCLGLPISHSYPVWFILPDALYKVIKDKLPDLQKEANNEL